MLDRFTSRARRVVALATEEARSRMNDNIGPEHLLMGLLRDGGGMAINVLERLEVQLETLRAEVERLLNEAPGSSTGSDPIFSPELRAVLQAALESRLHHPNVVGTETLLLGLLGIRGLSGESSLACGRHRSRRSPSRYLDVLRQHGRPDHSGEHPLHRHVQMADRHIARSRLPGGPGNVWATGRERSAMMGSPGVPGDFHPEALCERFGIPLPHEYQR